MSVLCDKSFELKIFVNDLNCQFVSHGFQVSHACGYMIHLMLKMN